MTEWPSDQVTGSFADDWLYGIFNTWMGITIRRMFALCLHSDGGLRLDGRVIIAGRRRGDCLLLRDKLLQPSPRTQTCIMLSLHWRERHSGLMNFDNLSWESINPLKPGDVTHKYFAQIKYHLQRGQKAGKTLQWPPRSRGPWGVMFHWITWVLSRIVQIEATTLNNALQCTMIETPLKTGPGSN